MTLGCIYLTTILKTAKRQVKDYIGHEEKWSNYVIMLKCQLWKTEKKQQGDGCFALKQRRLLTENSFWVATGAAALNSLKPASLCVAERCQNRSHSCSSESSLSLVSPDLRWELQGNQSGRKWKFKLFWERAPKESYCAQGSYECIYGSLKIKAFGPCCWELLWWILGKGLLMDGYSLGTTEVLVRNDCTTFMPSEVTTSPPSWVLYSIFRPNWLGT